MKAYQRVLLGTSFRFANPICKKHIMQHNANTSHITNNATSRNAMTWDHKRQSDGFSEQELVRTQIWRYTFAWKLGTLFQPLIYRPFPYQNIPVYPMSNLEIIGCMIKSVPENHHKNWLYTLDPKLYLQRLHPPLSWMELNQEAGLTYRLSGMYHRAKCRSSYHHVPTTYGTRVTHPIPSNTQDVIYPMCEPRC